MSSELTGNRSVQGNRLWLGAEIRAKWAQATAAECKPLIFGDLQKGDRFIALPFPGDNNGHGGLSGCHHLFEKTALTDWGIFGSNAIQLSNRELCHFKDNFLVIKVG